MKKIILIILFLAFLQIQSFGAEYVDNSIPSVSIGINANFGSFDMFHKNMDFENEPGLYAGGGITVEKMVYGIFGLGSGIQYRYFNTDIVFSKSGTDTDVTWTFQSINIPFLVILSFGGDSAAVNITGGLVYSNIFNSSMKREATATLSEESDNALQFINASQIGLTAEIVLKIKATEYTDFTLGITGEYFPKNLLYRNDKSGEKLTMVNYSITSGYMFRTNLFSGSSKKM